MRYMCLYCRYFAMVMGCKRGPGETCCPTKGKSGAQPYAFSPRTVTKCHIPQKVSAHHSSCICPERTSSSSWVATPVFIKKEGSVLKRVCALRYQSCQASQS